MKMKIFSFPLVFLGLHAVGRINAERLQAGLDNDKVLDILGQLDVANVSGEEELAAEPRKLNILGSRFSGSPSRWRTECSVSASLEAEVIVITDFSNPPAELKEVMPFLNEYWRIENGEVPGTPGDFDLSVDPNSFRILRMDYDALPAGVRKWREDELGTSIDTRFIAVQDGVAFFTPGVVKHVMPLFATKDVVKGANACQDELADMSSYNRFGNSPRASDMVWFESIYGDITQVGNLVTVQTSATKLVSAPEEGKGENTKKVNDNRPKTEL